MIIVSTTNDQYAKHLGVMLTSLLENSKNRERIKIFIIDGDLSRVNKKRLRQVVARYKKEITFLTPDHKLFRKFPAESTIGYITRDTYYRIGLPILLDKNIHKVLYLDCDLIVKGDLTRLWEINLKGYALAAVNETYWYGSWEKDRLLSELGLAKESLYFNAGVLLLNIKKWREMNVSKRLVNFLKAHPNLRYMDQDAMNVVLHRYWLRIHCKWNYTTYHWDSVPNVNPKIIHFCGWHKPWNTEIRYREDYLKYLQLSGWDRDKTVK
ncbi:glycosyltransferase family 8 protein [Ammoniphilus resinae]|uniref:Lipopolysaccharide biosynthesis glycosyltransferase n=1 Tax=Ammoniphilus resinae TaxID=861532 RepID=A0ABS4GLW5_9BACL|nr:glycosyltransferase family 8 protein [Ammoniphilus resinae]MBP1930895.1 lipopolysaccharide biosynthesis glycosyltransferase [Ammoniphilus resinae]